MDSARGSAEVGLEGDEMPEHTYLDFEYNRVLDGKIEGSPVNQASATC